MPLHTGQEVQPITPHRLGVWYEKLVPVERNADGTAKPRRTMRFLLTEPALRAFNDDRHTANALLEDGSVSRLAWYPARIRPLPGRWRLWWERLVGNPLLKAAAKEDQRIHVEVTP
jgi:hypothetical protein